MKISARENFENKFAFVMAMAGSAIGLGNIWRFPYIMGEYGGAAFVIVYLICSIIIALPIFYCEAILGRRTRQSLYCSMKAMAPGTAWKSVGIIAVVGSFMIVSYYSVVGGWSLDYFIRSCVTRFDVGSKESAASAFTGFSSSPFEPAVAFTVFLALSALIVNAGIKKGIEKFTRIATPLLAILITVVALFSVSLPGAEEGVEYLIRPDWNKITPEAVAYALGQSFFSLSLGVGCVVVYSSFMRKSENIGTSGLLTAGFDSCFAIIAGFAIMPAVFSAGLEPSGGPSLVFETLPYIFTKLGEQMPFLSRIMSILFFLSVLIAALTSSISMFEVCIEHSVDRTGISRRKTSALYFIGAWVLGMLCCLSFGVLSDVKLAGLSIFSFCDAAASNWFMTLIALATSLFVGWKIPKEEVREEFTNGGSLKINVKIFNFLYFLIRWVVPVMILVIFVTNLLL